VNRLSPDALDRVMDPTQRWRRRCNGHPEEGILVGRAELRVVLAASISVSVCSDGTLAWSAPSGRFTAEPVCVETQADP